MQTPTHTHTHTPVQEACLSATYTCTSPSIASKTPTHWNLYLATPPQNYKIKQNKTFSYRLPAKNEPLSTVRVSWVHDSWYVYHCWPRIAQNALQVLHLSPSFSSLPRGWLQCGIVKKDEIRFLRINEKYSGIHFSAYVHKINCIILYL